VIACVRSPGLQAVICFRLGHWLLSRNRALRLLLDPFFLVLNLYVQVVWGIELERAAKIGPGFIIGHFGGITLSGAAVIGANFNLCQCTTIGLAGTGAREGAPVIGNDVYVAPGARVFGKIFIGNNVKIGANTVVYRDIPDNAVVGCAGFRILSFKGNLRRDDAPLRDGLAKAGGEHALCLAIRRVPVGGEGAPGILGGIPDQALVDLRQQDLAESRIVPGSLGKPDLELKQAVHP
jgi:serine O-acetyltransferase